MTILIELFDREEPLSNVLSLTTLQPDILVMLGDTQITKSKTQRPVRQYLAHRSLTPETHFIACRTYDIEDIHNKLDEILRDYGAENCIIDVMGGTETLLVAVGLCCRDYPQLRVITQRAKTHELVWLWGPEKNEVLPVSFGAGVGEMISLAGGELLRNGHVDSDDLNGTLLDIIPKVFGVYMRNRDRWPAFVQYLQQLNEPEYQLGSLTTLCGPRQFIVNRRPVCVDLPIVMELEDAGVVEDFRMNSGTCTIQFTSWQLLRYLCDVGAWLELFVYAVLRRSGLFRAVEISAVISWDDDSDDKDIINELDVIALDGLGQLFISCKTNVPDNSVLNEIATLTERFGARYAVPVLVTACNLEVDAPGVYRRAMEMGIAVIDADDLDEELLLARMVGLKRRWCSY